MRVESIRRFLLWSSGLCPAVAIIAGLVAPSWPAERGLIFYIAPLFFLGPFWLRLRLEEPPFRWSWPWAADLAVFALAILRFATGNWLPFSGHMLFLTYSVLVTASGRYRSLALAVALETAWFKFVVWRDPRSFWLGVAGGIIAAMAWRIATSVQAPNVRRS